MISRYLKLFKQKKSHYISWNILFLWGFGLWIALCTSNMYHSDILEQEATLFYLQNPTFGFAHNISIKTEYKEDMLHITTRNYAVCNLILMLKDVVQYIHVFVSTSFVLFFICTHKCLRKVIKMWNNMVCNFHTVVSHVSSFTRDDKKIIFYRKMNKNDYVTLKSKLIVNSEINAEHLQTELNYDSKENEWILEQNRNTNTLNADINIVQNEITFSSYTLLLFNSYELYQYFSNQLLKNHLSSKCFVNQTSEYIDHNLKFSNSYARNNNSLSTEVTQKRIVSSSPEFQKFLANFKRSQVFYPCILELSTSYIIRIKSVYK